MPTNPTMYERKIAALRNSDNVKLTLLHQIALLATELCASIDCEHEDVGGCRSSLVILRELGPLTDQWEKLRDK